MIQDHTISYKNNSNDQPAMEYQVQNHNQAYNEILNLTFGQQQSTCLSSFETSASAAASLTDPSAVAKSLKTPMTNSGRTPTVPNEAFKNNCFNISFLADSWA